MAMPQPQHTAQLHQAAQAAQAQAQAGGITTAGNANGNPNAGPLSTSTASLMSQMTARISAQPQHSQAQQAQAAQQANELFPAFQLNAAASVAAGSNPWDTAAALGFPPQPPMAATASVAASTQPQRLERMAAPSPMPQAVAASVASTIPRPSSAVASMPLGGSLTNPPTKPSSSASVASSMTPKRKRSHHGSHHGSATANAILVNSMLAVSEDESERTKRRSERNLREQERSHRITERIGELRSVMSDAGVHFKPDRYSTLVSVVNYIKVLQGKSVQLDEEHKKLLDTISGADKLVNTGGDSLAPKGGVMGPTTTVQTHNVMENTASSNASSSANSNSDEEFLEFVQGIDYKSIFASCGVALAIASVDGRFVDCNGEFLRITDYSRKELLGREARRNSVLPHPQDSNDLVVSSSAASTLNAASAPGATAKTPDLHTSHNVGSSDRKSPLERKGGPPSEITMRKPHHLSLFNLLGGEDMECVYAAMSRMLRAHPSDPLASLSGQSSSAATKSTNEDSGGASSSSSNGDSCVKSELTRSTESASSGNDLSNEGLGPPGVGAEVENSKAGGATVDHWTGSVKHTRRKNEMLQLNISLVRTVDGRPKFFNCAISEIE